MRTAHQFTYALAVVFAAAVWFSTSCNRESPSSRFVAVYEAEHENGIETLTLAADGTYKHRFTRTDGREATSSGRWEIAHVDRKQMILVRDFTPYFPGRPHVATNWPLEPYEDYGLMRLYVSRKPRQFYLELPQKK